MLVKKYAHCRKLADLKFPSLLLLWVLLLTFTSSANTSDGQASSHASIEKLLHDFVRKGSSQLFSGTFVYIFEDQVQTIKVLRDIDDDGQIVERFVPLDGSKSNNKRILQNQHCLLDNGWQYQFYAMSSSFPFRVNNYFQELKKYYDFSLYDQPLPDSSILKNEKLKNEKSKNENVAGNQTVRLVIQAKDPYRYGYQLWFEPESATLLKYKLLNQNGKAVEQYFFTNINLNAQQNKTQQLQRIKLPGNLPACQDLFSGLSEAYEQYFNAQKLPDGYVPISFRKDFIKHSGRSARQFQLSDGLATASVFIEDIGKVDKAIDGVLKFGPMSVAGKTIGQHQVTVLGAIPIDSALQILEAINP
ncbi:MAG: MucB/RseB C-terminal domain-containing protein [Gammaproteobacteria bacterium]|nr:MucB/RseB C-terminal domain-containing protein [Gammaproteobacteria bacterium]